MALNTGQLQIIQREVRIARLEEVSFGAPCGRISRLNTVTSYPVAAQHRVIKMLSPQEQATLSCSSGPVRSFMSSLPIAGGMDSPLALKQPEASRRWH